MNYKKKQKINASLLIEYYENGATEPTKVKYVKVIEQPEVEQPLLFIYPETGKYGLNILAEDFLEAKATGGLGRFDYSVRAEIPAGSSLKIVIKPIIPTPYVCSNSITATGSLCGAVFYEQHKICSECGGVNSIHQRPAPWAWHPLVSCQSNKVG